MIKFGVFTVSTPDYTPEEAIQKLATFGYDGIEWRVCTDPGDREKPSFWSGNRTSMTADEVMQKADELKKLAEANHIAMPSLAAYIECYDLPVVEQHLKAAVAVGAKAVRIGCGGFSKDIPYKDQLNRARNAYSAVAEMAKQYNVRALIETHHGTLTPTIPLAMNVLQGLDPACTGIMWDPGNQVYEGMERYDFALGIAGEYLGEIHIKNTRYVPGMLQNNGFTWIGTGCQISSGIVNWASVFKELKDIGYDGWAMFEDFSTGEALDDRLKNNLAYIKSIC